MSAITQIVILVIVLSSMVMVLLAIRQLTHFESFDDENETRHLKKDVEENGNILSDNSIFSNLVETRKIEEENTSYKSKATDPVSRKE